MQVTVAGVDEQLNSSGMVVDFHDLRTALYELEALFDHSLILQDIDPIGGLAKEGGPLFELEERVVLLPYPPTVENMARYCFEYLVKELGTKMNILRVRLYETQSSYADYYNPTIRVA
jgi:6-pyruvoyltetrahydropterin/6-carboxytetrahydropterin synthase